MAHTAVPGLHLEQDEATRFWKVAGHEPKLSHLRRLWLKLDAYRTKKVSVVVGAALGGLMLAVMANQVSTLTLAHKNPGLSLKAPPVTSSTTSIDVSQVAYPDAQPAFTETATLPVPILDVPAAAQPPNRPSPVIGNQAPIPNGLNLAAITTLPRSLPPDLSTPSVSLKQAPKQPVKDDAPMSVFNEPLHQPKAVVSPPATVSALTTPSPPAVKAAVVVQQATPAHSKPVVLQQATPSGVATSKVTDARSTLQGTNSSNDPQPENPGSPASVQTRILAIPNTDSVVVTNPSTRLPMVVKIGDRLPDGSVLKSVDKANSNALNSRGETLSLR